ncbi:MAG: hypothetical protein COB02_17645 [Candidatus Cloacimonadota bacterium]|nr:MAG: hypothetical protein COB02_17645 [Candidatus Cloacimonadota bacterium]
MNTFFGIIHYGEDTLIYNLISSIELEDEDYIFILNHNLLNTLSFESSFIKTIHKASNLGFAIGMNFLINKAIELKFKNFIAINNDMVLKKRAAQNIKIRLEAKTILQGTLINEKGFVLSARNLLAKNFYWVKSIDRHKKVKEISSEDTDFICGGFFAIDLIGFKNRPILFDEDFFMYHEDIEWSKRLKEEGYQFKVIRNALAIHYESSATGGKITRVGMLYRWNSLLILLKKLDKSFFYNFISIILFVARMLFAWIRYGFR